MFEFLKTEEQKAREKNIKQEREHKEQRKEREFDAKLSRFEESLADLNKVLRANHL